MNSIMIWCEALSLMVGVLVVKIEGSVEIRSLEFCGGSFSASRANQHKVEHDYLDISSKYKIILMVL